jgi:hypothetical protein
MGGSLQNTSRIYHHHHHHHHLQPPPCSAYIETSIWGTNFCTSCYNVFSLLTRHLSLIAVVNGVAYLVVFIIKLGIVAGASFVTYVRGRRNRSTTHS